MVAGNSTKVAASVADVLQQMGVDPQKGLSAAEAQARLD